MVNVVVAVLFVSGLAESAKILNIAGFLPMSGTTWNGGKACLTGIEMAFEHIHARQDILVGYEINFMWDDTKCEPGIAAYKMFQLLNQLPVKCLIIGAGCSTSSAATAQSSHLWNLTQISYGSSSPLLSDRKKYPKFFRLAPPDTALIPARIAILKQYNWQRIATIHESFEIFSAVTEEFLRALKLSNITVITAEIFKENPAIQVENLKRHDARIIIASSYQLSAVKLLCEAYRAGLYWPKIVWILLGWYGENWWKKTNNFAGINCTQDQLNAVVEGVIQMGYFFRNPKTEKGLAGITATEFDNLYVEKLNDTDTWNSYGFVGGPCYDTAWAVALALNTTIQNMTDAGYKKTLDQFTYEDADINDLITNAFFSMSFIGVRGRIMFGANGDPIVAIKLDQIWRGDMATIGLYNWTADKLEWSNGGLQWEGGIVPKDSTLVIRKIRFLSSRTYIMMCSFAATGILLGICLLLFNIVYRNSKNVKMSSPNINNLLLIGCMLTYCTVFLQSFDKKTVIAFCKARTYCFCLGFAMSFGSLFSKTWRVYRIFANKTQQGMKIKDTQLLGLVLGMLLVDTIILVLQELIDPMSIREHQLPTELHAEDNDVEIHPYFLECTSRNGFYFESTLYIIQGVLLAFGSFLAWETRKVHIDALNDSYQIGVCIYNVVVLSALGVALSFALDAQVELIYGFISGFIILGTTLTQLIVFVPKVLKTRKDRRVVGAQQMSSEKSGYSMSSSTRKPTNNSTTRTTLTEQARESSPLPLLEHPQTVQA
ncbi:hypothetical protein ScPMuIL_016442 [Solemya velum]